MFVTCLFAAGCSAISLVQYLDKPTDHNALGYAVFAAMVFLTCLVSMATHELRQPR